MRDVRRHFKNFARQMVDPVHQTAAAGNENPSAAIIDERLLFDRPLEQLESFAQGVINAMTGNAAFPTPPVTLANLQTAQADFASKLAAALFSGQCFTVERQ